MAQIVASLHALGVEQTQRQTRNAAMSGADWVELRLDEWPDGVDLRPLIESLPLPAIVTCRVPGDGGRYRGTPTQRRELLTGALRAGARGLDLEDWEKWAPPRGMDRLQWLIRSHHDLHGIPADLPRLRDRLLGMGATMAKIAVTAPDLADAAPVLELMASSDPADQPTAAFAMGAAAMATRILGPALGSPLVYGSVGNPVAPGQIPVQELAGVHRVRELGPETQLFGLLGNPARHSLGPWVHNRAFRRLGVDGIYVALESSRPAEVLAALPRRRLGGMSVTAPHKQLLARHCHRLDDHAEATGAVNTLTFGAHGAVMGHNTDVAGIQHALRDAGAPVAQPGSDTHPAVVLGGGGTARAAVVALAELGYRVTVLARSLDPMREWCRNRRVELGALRTELLQERAPTVVVHTTPVGQEGAGGPGAQARLLPDWVPPSGSFVLDAVYRPVWTPLLLEAAAAGAVAIPGTEMFLHQAAVQFELFTGHRPPVEMLRGYAGWARPRPR